MLKFAIAVAGIALAIAAPTTASAAVFNEAPGDAGRLLATADIFSGNSAITQIRGRKGADNGVDMFEIFIPDPTMFRARVGNNQDIGDSQLFLFDSMGMGVLGNDDRPGGLGSRLNDFTGPGGIYYLAITGFDTDPVSIAGEIFPDTPFTAIHGPIGPGGGSPLIGWTNDGDDEIGDYRIRLRGAFTSDYQVSEPATLVLMGLGLVGMASLRRRR